MLQEKAESIYARPLKEAYVKALRYQLELDCKLKHTEQQLSVKREELLELTADYAKIIRTQNQEVNDLTEQVDRIDPEVSQKTHEMSRLIEVFVASVEGGNFEKAREDKRQYQELESSVVSTLMKASKSLGFTVESNSPLETIDQLLEEVVDLHLEVKLLLEQQEATGSDFDEAHSQAIMAIGGVSINDDILQSQIRTLREAKIPDCQINTAWLADDYTGDTIAYFYDPEGSEPRLGIAILNHNNALSSLLHPSDDTECFSQYEQHFEYYLEHHLINDPRIYQVEGTYLEVLAWQHQAYVKPDRPNVESRVSRRFGRRSKPQNPPLGFTGWLRRLKRNLQNPV